MSSALKRLCIVLGAITALMLIILFQQIKTAASITTTANTLPIISPIAVDIAISKTDHLLGNPGAPLTVVAFFDITDARSKKYFLELREVVTKNPTKVRLIWKHFPKKTFLFDPTTVHQGLHCAGVQGRFWQFAELLAQEKRVVRDSRLKALAEQDKLNITAWEACMQTDETKVVIATDVAIGQSLYLPYPPMLFVNNKLLNLEDDIDIKELVVSLLD